MNQVEPELLSFIWFIFVMIIDTGSKVIFSNRSSMPMTSRSRSQTWKFLILKFLKSSYFPNHAMVLLYICYDDRYRSKGLFNNTPAHAYDFKVKVTDLEIFNTNVFKSSYFLNHMMDWVYI